MTIDLDSARRAAAEADALASKATPGPWSASPPSEKADAVLYVQNGGWLANVGNWARCSAATDSVELETIETEHQANAEFMASARTSVPRLAAHVEELVKEVERLRGWAAWIGTVAREHELDWFDRERRGEPPIEDGGAGWGRFVGYARDALNGDVAPDHREIPGGDGA